MLRNTIGLVGLTALIGASGCGPKEDSQVGEPGAVQCPPGQFFDGRYCVPQSPAAGVAGQPAPVGGAVPAAPYPGAVQPGAAALPGAQPPAAGGAPAPGSPVPAAPPAGVPQGPVATAQAGPQATPLNAAATPLAAQALSALAQQYIPSGAKQTGAAVIGQFQQGQSLELQVQMQPGKCYTVVGAGLLPIQNVDLKILPTIPLPGFAAPVLAQDQSVGPNAVIGEKANCYRWAFPIASAVKVVVTVSQGAGIAGAQVYEK